MVPCVTHQEAKESQSDPLSAKGRKHREAADSAISAAQDKARGSHGPTAQQSQRVQGPNVLWLEFRSQGKVLFVDEYRLANEERLGFLLRMCRRYDSE